LRPVTDGGELRLTWATVINGPVLYSLLEVDEEGQLAWVDQFEQGPFDTALEVSQWAVRAIAKRVPPSRC